MLRLALGISKTGFFGLTTRKKMRMMIPVTMRRRLSMMHTMAPHQTKGLVGRLEGKSLGFLGSAIC